VPCACIAHAEHLQEDILSVPIDVPRRPAASTPWPMPKPASIPSIAVLERAVAEIQASGHMEDPRLQPALDRIADLKGKLASGALPPSKYMSALEAMAVHLRRMAQQGHRSEMLGHWQQVLHAEMQQQQSLLHGQPAAIPVSQVPQVPQVSQVPVPQPAAAPAVQPMVPSSTANDGLISALFEMGFTNCTHNATALQTCGNDVSAAITWLDQHPAPPQAPPAAPTQAPVPAAAPPAPPPAAQPAPAAHDHDFPEDDEDAFGDLMGLMS